MKTIAEIAAIVDALDFDTYASMYDSDDALTALGLTREEFDAYCSFEDCPEGDTPEDWSDPVWDT